MLGWNSNRGVQVQALQFGGNCPQFHQHHVTLYVELFIPKIQESDVIQL